MYENPTPPPAANAHVYALTAAILTIISQIFSALFHQETLTR